MVKRPMLTLVILEHGFYYLCKLELSEQTILGFVPFSLDPCT